MNAYLICVGVLVTVCIGWLMLGIASLETYDDFWDDDDSEEPTQTRAQYFLANADKDGCYVVHAPEIEGGWCEIHKAPIYEGNPCKGKAS